MSLTVRKPRLPIPSAEGGRHWLGGNLVVSHALSAMGALISRMERFVIRAVRARSAGVDDRELAETVRAFALQEAQHTVWHRRFDALLEEQGFEVEPAMKRFDRVLDGMLDRLSPMLVLSVAMAMEHLFACLGDYILRARIMDEAEAGWRALWEWHAVEEIEHRAVAFDLFTHHGGGWALRMLGMAIAWPVMFVAWRRLVWSLLRQDPDYSRDRHRRERAAWLGAGRPSHRGPFVRYALPYLSPRFHPGHLDCDDVVEEALARLDPHLQVA